MAKYAFNEALVLVTGAASGIGRVTARMFAESGAKVVAADINLPSVNETLQGTQNESDHTAIKVDVSNESSVKQLSDSIISKYKASPFVVVHAAGIFGKPRSTIFDATESEWNQVIDINLKGTFLVNRIFGGLMRDQKMKGASIVNFASIAARLGFPAFFEYCASKAGVVSLTQNFSLELAPFEIRVNAVAPSGIPTPLFNKAPKQARDALLQMIPQKRLGEPEEVARLCLFLASKESSYINGQTVYITGGI